MTVVATFSKWLAAWITQKIYGMQKVERSLIFGLSNAQAAATLAAVLIGHEIIMENGERLLKRNGGNDIVYLHHQFGCDGEGSAPDGYTRKPDRQ